ncbi:Lachesin-like 7 [Homarus americanus]|uniref:Lachesin-like 7 n=1 Tax=Homarus americanus TaxID=6706 RepID=A0A8J5N163_HOMAM|nr:Lachesin-like 7 [Homarus americanus]
MESVAWVQVDTQTILTIHKQVITRNPRIALLHNDHRTWHLELKNVREKDRGWYMCQVNTDPMRYRQGYVDVVVPPDIIDRESSDDMTIREGQDVTLTCRAKGHPTPSIVWRREDNEDIVLDNEKTVPPVAWVPQQLEGAYIGQELTIECHTEAFPKSINYWTNTNGDMIVADERYEPIVTENSYKVYMKLRIRRVEPQDIGTFKCIAKNSR